MNSIRTVYSSSQFLSLFLRRRRLKATKLLNSSAFHTSSELMLHTSPSFDKNKSGAGFEPSEVPIERIRNFSIVAHVDHGKSTLADRILELVGAVEASADNKQILDKLPVERERGITVKAQTASVIYEHKGEEYLLNLIDTPGHVDFSSEVSRSLLACQGVILLVDANQGVQAQTVSNFYLAFANDLVIVPVLNKVDLSTADPERVKEEMNSLFDIDPSAVLHASAKTGLGVAEVLGAVVDKIPPPDRHGRGQDLRLLLQDSWYDKYKGTVNLVQVVDGVLKLNDQVTSLRTKKSYAVKTMGILTPFETPVQALYPGQVGYFTCSMKSPSEALVGDTFHAKDRPVESLGEVQAPKPMVFAGFYPQDSTELSKLRSAIEKTCLNDRSVSVGLDSSLAMGSGWRLGFLGVLHMEVFQQRMSQEFDAEVIVTAPTVPYKITVKESKVRDHGKEVLVSNPNNWLDRQIAEKYSEPTVRGTIISPLEYMNDVVSLCAAHRGAHADTTFIDEHRVKLEFTLPLNEIITDFFNELKQMTSGYGSFDYEDAGYVDSDVVKVEMLTNGEPVPELAFVCHASKAREKGKKMVARMQEEIPRQQYSISLQASVGSKILARSDIKAIRKDVTAKCYGGDLTRKMKLLKHQAEGKKQMKAVGKVRVPKQAYISLLKHS